MPTDIWPLVHAERLALAADLESLSDAHWTTPSLCSDWTVRDALAHMTATANMTPPKFIGQFVSSGFRFSTVTDRGIAAALGATPADTLARFNSARTSTSHPPGPTDTWLCETVLHAEDIRRPLGITHHYSTDALVRVASFARRTNPLLGSKRRAEGLRLRATDVTWTEGEGPEVAGPIMDIVLALTGRRAGLAALSGDGVATLTTRL